MLVWEVVETPRDSELGEREVQAREVRGRRVVGDHCRCFLGEHPGVEESQEGIGPQSV